MKEQQKLIRYIYLFCIVIQAVAINMFIMEWNVSEDGDGIFLA